MFGSVLLVALVFGSAAGLPLRCSWMPPVYREIGRVEPPCEPRRASDRPCPGLPDVADDLPRPDALAVHAPLIAWRSAPHFALDVAPKKGTRMGYVCGCFIYNYIYGVSKPCVKIHFLSVHRQKSDCKNAPNRKPLCQRLQNCIKNSLRGLPRPDAPRPDFPGLHLIKQMPPSCDGRHALAGRV